MIKIASEKDFLALASIDAHAFEDYWSLDRFKQELTRDNVVCFLHESNEIILGFIIFEILPKRIVILRIGVFPSYRRQGIGGSLVKSISESLIKDDRTLIAAEVRETNLNLQKFFSKINFIAIEVLREYYEDSKEDCYIFHQRKSEKT